MDEADVVVAWLADHDVTAVIPDRHTTQTLGLPNLIPSSIEVCVADEAQYNRALALIAEHEQTLAQHVASAVPTGSLEITCDNCGKKFDVPSREIGHVVDCPHCHEYVDVPDPSASDEDYAEETEEQE